MFGAFKVVLGAAALSTALGAGPVAVVGPEQRGGRATLAPAAQHTWTESAVTLRDRAGADRGDRGAGDARTNGLQRARLDVDFDVEFDARSTRDERSFTSSAATLRFGLFGGRDRDGHHGRNDRSGHRDDFACRANEVAPCNLDIDAYQHEDAIFLTVRGSNRSAGYTTTLERVKHRGRTVVALRNIGPAHHAHSHFGAQALCHFELAGTLSARGCVETISVYVAGQERCVQVRQLNSIPRAW